jgi:hypothetical protein
MANKYVTTGLDWTNFTKVPKAVSGILACYLYDPIVRKGIY